MKIKHPHVHQLLAAGSIGIVLLATGACAAQSSPVNAESGPALLSRVQREYRHIAGVELVATGEPADAARRFLLRLRDGKVTGEAFRGPGRHGTALVARSGGPTFLRAAGARCWHRLAAPDPRTLVNVDGPFPDHGKALVRSDRGDGRRLVIETHSALWFLAGRVVPAKIALKSFLTLTLNPGTDAIRSIGVSAPEHSVRAELKVTPLAAAPSLPSPRPAC